MSRWSPRHPRKSSTPPRNSRLRRCARSTPSSGLRPRIALRTALSLKGPRLGAATSACRRWSSASGLPGREPAGAAPALVEDGHAWPRASPIIEYLDEAHPEPPFLPHGPVQSGGPCAAAQPDHRLRHPPAQQHPRAQVARAPSPATRASPTAGTRTRSPKAFAASRRLARRRRRERDLRPAMRSAWPTSASRAGRQCTALNRDLTPIR